MTTNKKQATKPANKPASNAKAKAKQTKAKPKGFPGRKGYTQEQKDQIFDSLIDWISEGKSVKKFVEEKKVSFRTIYELIESSEDNKKIYSRACAIRSEVIAEEILDISDDNSRDKIHKVGRDGQLYEEENSEFVNRSKLRVHARQWYLSKVNPKKYGDKIEVDQKTEHSGSIAVPITGMIIKSENKEDPETK